MSNGRGQVVKRDNFKKKAAIIIVDDILSFLAITKRQTQCCRIAKVMLTRQAAVWFEAELL